jgi:hypothetical protein
MASREYRRYARVTRRAGEWAGRLAPIVLMVMLAGCGGGGSGTGGGSQYTVGGTITLAVVNALPGGLPRGLTLTDGTDQLAVAASATHFTFPTALASGHSYAVAVTQNPPGLVCTVSNGAGTIGASDVDGIVVSCADAAYTVGGTVSGLTSSGLTLTDASGDKLVVAAGSSRFTLPGSVTFGSPYAVTVQQQPQHQTCSLSAGTGVMGPGNVSNVTITCPLTVLPQSVTLAAGASQQFTATLQPASGGTVTWLVNGVAGGNTANGVITSGGLYTAPLAAVAVQISATSTTDAGVSASADLVGLAPHTIAARPTPAGIAEFYDRATGKSWVARGNNFIRLATQTDFGGNSTVYHSTFNVGLYDSADVESALTAMQASGYNAARVFLNGCCVGSIGNPAGGLSAAYMANVADFLARAQRHGIYVIFTQDGTPATGGYDVTCPAAAPSAPQIQSVNASNLCAGGIDAAQRFHRDFVQSLVQQQAPVSVILGYELRNEYFYESAAAPFTSSSGLVTTANGSTYDMSDAASRQKMMDEGLVYLTDQLRAAIVAVDPTALVTVGFFWPQTPNPTRIGDTRLISVYPAMATSTADFIDIHGYVIINDLAIDQLVQNYGFVGHQQKQPVIMAEYGAFKNAVPLMADAVTALRNWQIGGCGYGLRGWLLWTWDTPEQDADLWNATAGDGSINTALAPVTRPDPCVP